MMKRRALVGWIVGAAVAVTAVAGAAALTLTITDSLAGGTASVPTCDTTVDVAMSTPTYVNPPGGYAVSGVQVSNLDEQACDGQTVRVALVNTAGVQVAEATAVVDDSTWTNPQPIALDQAAQLAEVQSVSIAISTN